VLGTKEVLRDAAGAIVVQEDVTAFAAAVVQVLKNPALRAELASAGRNFVARRWSSHEMAKRLLELYADVAAVANRRQLARLAQGS
jgi:1,2-diacylglycerol 3-alpha-glucosyltransferase